MSWQLASALLLAAALAAGFGAYERSRPSSRIVALVGTLAALAVVGRLAFAAFPNVKPTTDVVLIAGYTLGAPAGFAVGAVTALASNFVFGQGPWTPWQMAAWGLVGVAGAGLAAVGGRRLGRVPMALCCGLAGLGFGLIVDLSTFVVFTGRHTLAQYLLIEGQAFSFNAAHAVGNVLFYLAFGPALVRALMRFRARFEVRWLPVTASLLLLFAAAPAALGADGRAGTIARAAGYLNRAQSADGGFGGARGGRPTQLYTAWAALGLVAAGHDASRAAAWMRAHLAQLSGTGDAERTLLALGAAGGPPPHALLATVARAQRRDGSFDGQVNLTAFGILALRASGRAPTDPRIRRARPWLARQQNSDGGFNFGARGGLSGVDDSAAALEGLVAADEPPSSRVVVRAARFLAAQQNPDGGFPLVPRGASNAQSSSWAIQGLMAAGRNPHTIRRHGARDPLSYLGSLVAPDGAVRYSPTSAQTPVWVTGQALTALAGKPFPLVGLRPAPVTAPTRAQAPARGASTGPAPAPGAQHARPHLRRVPAPEASDFGASAGLAVFVMVLALTSELLFG